MVHQLAVLDYWMLFTHFPNVHFLFLWVCFYWRIEVTANWFNIISECEQTNIAIHLNEDISTYMSFHVYKHNKK